MAEITIKIKDSPGGKVDIDWDFDPSINDETEMTPALTFASRMMEQQGELVKELAEKVEELVVKG